MMKVYKLIHKHMSEYISEGDMSKRGHGVWVKEQKSKRCVSRCFTDRITTPTSVGINPYPV